MWRNRGIRRREFGRGGNRFDKGIVGGLALSAVFLLVGLLMAGPSGWIASVLGLVIVAGGTFAATLVQFALGEVKQAWWFFRQVLVLREFSPASRMDLLVSLAQSAKRNGLLVLDREAERTSDRFLRLGLQLAVDGQPEPEIRRILDLERQTALERDARAVQVFETMGNYAPALGLIGTLFGLIQMLGSLNDPATVGPAMAVALTTTLYGAVLANMILHPIAGKLRTIIQEQSAIKLLTVEGIVSLAREENPVMLQQRLQSFLPLAKAA